MRLVSICCSASLLALALTACGGTVVFDDGDGTGGDGGRDGTTSGGGGRTGATTATGTNGATTGTSAPTTTSSSPDGSSEVTDVGPGPGSGGASPGPAGVGGADSGPSGGISSVSSGPDGCNEFIEQTVQYCYGIDSCVGFTLEAECQLDSGAPYTCWCYENGEILGSCAQDERPSCLVQSECCANLWRLPG